MEYLYNVGCYGMIGSLGTAFLVGSVFFSGVFDPQRFSQKSKTAAWWTILGCMVLMLLFCVAMVTSLARELFKIVV